MSKQPPPLKTPKLSRGCTLVMEALKASTKLQTAREIYDQLRTDLSSDAPGLTTVYRAIDTLISLQLVQPVELGQGEKSYEYVEPGQHHHHLICVACTASVHLDNCMVEDMTRKIETSHGFEVRSHLLEVFGLCPDCKSARPF